MTHDSPPDALLDARDSDEGRAVLADWLEEHGWSPRLARKRLPDADAAAAAVAASDASDADAAAADATAAAYDAATDVASDASDADASDAAADASADAADTVDDASADSADAVAASDASADASAADDAQPTLKLRREELMKDGFKVLQFRSRYNYLATFAGWVRHVRGDHYEMANFRAVVRKSGYAWDGLMRLAAEGPSEDYALTDMSAPGVAREFLETEAVNVHHCIEASWVKHCLRPEGWES